MDWEETSVPGCSQHNSIFSLPLSAYCWHEASPSFQGSFKFPNVPTASKPQTDRRRCFPLGVITFPLPGISCSLCDPPVKRCRNVRQRDLHRRPLVVRDTGPCCGRCSGEQNPHVQCEGCFRVYHAWWLTCSSSLRLIHYNWLHAMFPQGSATAMTVFFPLDTAKSRLQGEHRVLSCWSEVTR